MSKSWKSVSGYCPVSDSEKTITVEYETRGQGAAKVTVAGWFKCPEQDPANAVCSRCPIFYAPATQTP